MTLTRAETVVGGRRARYLVGGSGEPVVLVHGLSASSRWWRRCVPALVRQHTVYLVDLPGFGLMRRPLGRYILAGAPQWLAGWMDAVELERAHVVGHSMGGFIAMGLAGEWPSRVARLVLVAPAGVPTGRSLAGYVPPLAATARTTMPQFLPLVVPDAVRAGPWTLLQASRQLLREDVTPNLARITCPTLLMWGDRDPLVPPDHGRILRRLIPDARLLLLTGASHMPMDEHPHEFNEAVLAFLRSEPVGE